MLDKIKLFLALLIIAVGISGFYLLAEMPLVVRVGGFIASLIVAALVALTSEVGKTFAVYVERTQEGGLAHAQGNNTEHRDGSRVCFRDGGFSVGC